MAHILAGLMLAAMLAAEIATPSLAAPSAEELALLVIKGQEARKTGDHLGTEYVLVSSSPARLEERSTLDGETSVMQTVTVTRKSDCQYLFDTEVLSGILAGDKISYTIDFSSITGIQRVTESGITFGAIESTGPYCELIFVSSPDYKDFCKPFGSTTGMIVGTDIKTIEKSEAALKTMKSDICR